MSHTHPFTSVYASEMDDSFMLDEHSNAWVPLPVRQEALPPRDSGYFEEYRNERAYNDFKENIYGSVEYDPRMEADFFGRRELSISDLNGTRSIDARRYSPSPSLDINYETPYEAFEVISPMYQHETSGPFWYVAGRRFTRAPSREDIARIEAQAHLPLGGPSSPLSPSRYDSSSPITPVTTPRPVPSTRKLHIVYANRNQNLDARPDTPEEPARKVLPSCCDFHRKLEAGLYSLVPPDLIDMIDQDEWCGSSEPTERLEKLVDAGLKCGNSSIRGIGVASSSVVIKDDLIERAYATSESARISNISTIKSTLSIDSNSSDTESPCEQAGDDHKTPAHSGSSPRHSSEPPKNDSQSPRTPRCSATSPAYGPSPTSAGLCEDDLDVSQGGHQSMLNADYFRVASSVIHIPSPTVKQEVIDLTQDSPGQSAEQFTEIRKHQSTRSIEKPRYHAVPTIGRLEESSLFKRRTKQTTDSAIKVPKWQPVSFLSKSSSDSETLSPVRISKTPTYADVPRVKKRSAPESFDLTDAVEENSCRESKKVRLSENPTLDSATSPTTPQTTVSSVFDGSPMATALKGYPGQFDLHMPQALSNTKSSTATRHVFGNHLHANGEIINTNYISDPYKTTSNLSDHADLRNTIEHADLQHMFAEQMVRSQEEEELRKEAHRECAAAKLEGVPVGYYRYFAGHMTVEEYIEAKLCVCWKGCFCNKLCTHFGDLACPCAGDLVVGDEA